MDSNKGDERPDKANGEKPLPRGLEHVSHIFLSRPQTAHPTPENSQTPPADQSGTKPADPPVTVVLRPCSFSSREPLAVLLKKQAGAIEEGLKAIDSNIPCETSGAIDVLAIDSKNQMVIIDLEEHSNDALLLRGIDHADWIVRNIANVRRMYQAHPINFTLPPRLFLVAPDFSPLFRSVAGHIASLQIECLKYHAIALSGGIGIFFEPVLRSGS
jgi:hypothetical protein